MQDFATTGLQISDFRRVWVLKKCYGVKIAKFAMITGQFVRIVATIMGTRLFWKSATIMGIGPRLPANHWTNVIDNFWKKWVLDWPALGVMRSRCIGEFSFTSDESTHSFTLKMYTHNPNALSIGLKTLAQTIGHHPGCDVAVYNVHAAMIVT